MRGVSDVDRLRSRPNVMDDGINPFEDRDVNCSGRSLATLLVAWVGAAMVASVLLRWKYMWIALTILTLLFLFACGYAACNARRAHERAMASEEARIIERQRRDRNIQSVSVGVDNCAEVSDPPAYETYWITDLPPPYAAVIGAESPLPAPASMPRRSADSEPTTPTRRISNPPPYSIAIQSDQNTDPSQAFRQMENHSGATSTSIDEPTNSRTERVTRNSIGRWNDEIKISNEQTATRIEEENSSNNSSRIATTGNQYLTSLISCTFGRGQRRNNVERNATTSTIMTTRDRPGIFQLNNRDDEMSASRMSSSTL